MGDDKKCWSGKVTAQWRGRWKARQRADVSQEDLGSRSAADGHDAEPPPRSPSPRFIENLKCFNADKNELHYNTLSRLLF